ncbi:YqaJ viral recombinase family protein [Anaerorhabdus sp.]|uniref:YqaJ viral recombinase family protein n=1 Tax=Anaerorhabdus sp. TaxID=1872524 RepID=UPI002FC8A89A
MKNSLYQDTDIYKCLKFKNEKEWLKGRSVGIGGSSASSLVNKNPWQDLVSLWEEKKGIRIPEDISDKPAVMYGKKAEKYIRGLFELDYLKYEVQYLDNVTLQNKEIPWMMYSPDGLLIEKETGRKGILEIKTTNIMRSMQREEWKDSVPINYYIQVLHGLLVTNFDFVELRAQLKSEWKLDDGTKETRIQVKDYHIERSEALSDLEWLLSEEETNYKRYFVGNEVPNTNLEKFLR